MTASVAETALAKKLDNLTLKEWLREVGPVRRKEILKKLKVELEGLGLPKLRHGLRHGLIHLFSECSVIVERLPSNSTLGCDTKPDESCQNEKATCNKHDTKKRSDEIVDVLSVEGKAGFSNSHQLFASDEFLINRVSNNNDPENLSTNHLKQQPSFTKNSTKLSHENLGAKDDSFKTPYLPSTKNSQSQKTKACPLSLKNPLESKCPSNPMSKSTTKECFFFEHSSTINNNSVLEYISESRVSPLAKAPIAELENFVTRAYLNCEKPISPKRRYSDTFLDTSNRRRVSRDERSCSKGESVRPSNDDTANSTYKHFQEEFQELVTEIRKKEFRKASSLVEKALKNPSLPVKLSSSSELANSLGKGKVALPVKINLGVIKDLSRLSDSKFNHEHQDNTETESETELRLMPDDLEPSDETQEPTNLQQGTILKEKKKCSHKENESSRRKSSKLEDVESVKKKKKKPVKRKKSLKLVFRELFGEEEENGVKKNLNAETKRRKVDSRDSCDSGAYCSEASPISVTAYSKDADPSEMFSPDSTEKVKDLERLESPLQSEICLLESKDSDKTEKIPQLVDNLDNLQKETNDERVLPDSSTCISDDEVTLVECRTKSPEKTVADVPSKKSEDEQQIVDLSSPSKGDSNAPGPSDDTLSKAGIVRDLEKDSYVFSSDDINILLNILSENPKNPAQQNRAADPTEEHQTDSGKDCTDPVVSENTSQEPHSESLDLDDELSDDVEIVLEKGPSTTKRTQISDLEKRLSTGNQIEVGKVESADKPSSEEPVKVSFPRLRVKAPSELGCSAPLSPVNSTADELVNSPIFHPSLPNPVPVSLPMWTRPHLELPASTSSSSSSSNPIPAVLSQHHNPKIPRVNMCNDQFSASPNQVVNVALAAAQRLISLIDPLVIPDAPQLSHYYNMLISLLGEISNDTVFLRNSYVNRTYGLLSPDLFAYNLSLNRKLRNLSKFLHVAFEENTMQFILDNYHVLTTRPILNKDELYYVMSLQYSDLDANQEHPANQGSINAARISTDPQIRLPSPATSQQSNARKTNSKTKSKKQGKGGFTNEHFIILKSQIKAYNTLAKKLKQLLQCSHFVAQTADVSRVQQSDHSHLGDLSEKTVTIAQSNSNLHQQEARVESPRIVQQSSNSNLNQQHSRVASPRNIQPSSSVNSTVVFRRRPSQGAAQVAERIEDRSGLVITPVTTASAVLNKSSLSTKPLSAKPVASRDSGLTPFPRGLSITAVIPTTATPVASTVSVSVAKNSSATLTQTGCTITPISIASRVSTIAPATVPSTPSKIVSSVTPSVIVSAPVVSSPILSSVVSAPLSSVPCHRYPLITLNETPPPKQTKLYMRLNSPLPAVTSAPNSASPVVSASAAVSASPAVSACPVVSASAVVSASPVVSASAVVSASLVVSAPIASLPIVAVTILSAPIVSPAPSVPLQGTPLISNQTRVIASNPAYNVGSKFSVTNISPIPTPTISTILQTAFPAPKASANRKTYPSPKTRVPSSNLANLLKQIKTATPPEHVKERLATKATDSTTADAVTVETEFRSMPSLSPDPSPSLKNNDQGSSQLDKSSKSSPKANEDDDEEEDLLCFRCQRKSTVVCARCQIAIYCSKLCQEKHWEEIHHETCQDSSVERKKSATDTKDN